MRKRKLGRYVLGTACIVCAGIVIRIFAGEIAVVSSVSMEPTLHSGDRIWIDKLSYGASLPVRYSEIPIINVFTWISRFRERDMKNQWKYRRMRGFTMPREGDVAVFHHPENRATLLIKRIGRILHRGDSIVVTSGTWNDYAGILSCEKGEAARKNDSLLVAGGLNLSCRLTENYYFLLGDHDDNSWDSRHFGYLCEKELVGKAGLLLFSKKRKRMMQRIR